MIDDHYPLGGMRLVHVLVHGRQDPQIRSGPFVVRGNDCLIKPAFYIELNKTLFPLLPGLGLSTDAQLGLNWVRPTFGYPGGEFTGLMAALRPANFSGSTDQTLFVVVEFVDVDMKQTRLHADLEFCGARSIPSLWLGICSHGAVIYIETGPLHHRLINHEGTLICEDRMWGGNSFAAPA